MIPRDIATPGQGMSGLSLRTNGEAVGTGALCGSIATTWLKGFLSDDVVQDQQIDPAAGERSECILG